jgi:site-specific recombinase XerD
MYQLRHSFITVGIQMGVPVVKLAELVGNSAPTINRVYARLLTTEDERFRELMAGVFGQ